MTNLKFNIDDNDLCSLAYNLMKWKETAYTNMVNAEEAYQAILDDYEAERSDDWEGVQKASKEHTIASEKYELLDDLVYRLKSCADDIWFLLNE